MGGRLRRCRRDTALGYGRRQRYGYSRCNTWRGCVLGNVRQRRRHRRATFSARDGKRRRLGSLRNCLLGSVCGGRGGRRRSAACAWWRGRRGAAPERGRRRRGARRTRGRLGDGRERRGGSQLRRTRDLRSALCRGVFAARHVLVASRSQVSKVSGESLACKSAATTTGSEHDARAYRELTKFRHDLAE